MCWLRKTGGIRRINQLALEAIRVSKPNLPLAIYGLGSDPKWIRRLSFNFFAAKATWPPFDMLIVVRHATSSSLLVYLIGWLARRIAPPMRSDLSAQG